MLRVSLCKSKFLYRVKKFHFISDPSPKWNHVATTHWRGLGQTCHENKYGVCSSVIWGISLHIFLLILPLKLETSVWTEDRESWMSFWQSSSMWQRWLRTVDLEWKSCSWTRKQWANILIDNNLNHPKALVDTLQKSAFRPVFIHQFSSGRYLYTLNSDVLKVCETLYIITDNKH